MVILSDDTSPKREVIRCAREREVTVGAGVWMWWTDELRPDDGRVGAFAVCKHGHCWKAFGSHLGSGQVEVNNIELWAIGLAVHEAVRERDMLQTHSVKRVAIFSDSRVTIQRTEYLVPGPG